MYNEILKKVKYILNLEYSDFCESYNNNCIATGDTCHEYSEYFIQLDELNYLIVTWIQFEIKSFSIISDKHLETIIERQNELFDYSTSDIFILGSINSDTNN